MINKLFVYGTLCPGKPNEHILTNIGGSYEAGTIRGTLYAEGWGATMGYSAVVPNEQGEEVHGFVFSSDNLANHWGELDEFEGEAYKRVLTPVKLFSNRTVQAYVYALAEDGK